MPDDPAFYKDLLDNLYDGVYFVDRQRLVTFWNKGAEHITGYSASQVIGKSCRDNILNHVTADGLELCATHCPLAATMDDGHQRAAEVFLHHADGHRVPVYVRSSPIRNAEGEIIGAVETFSDYTTYIQMRRKNEQLQKTILLDPLTGIGNRRHVEMKAKAALDEFQETDEPFGLLFFDIDHFKRVNDIYGHAVGDIVLRMVGNTLRRSIRSSDTAGRWGGEEFVVLAGNLNVKDLAVLAEKLRMLVEKSRLDVEQGPLQVTVSIGATLATCSDTPETLFKRADELMYASKQRGRNQVKLG